ACSRAGARRWPCRCCWTPGRPAWPRCWPPAASGHAAVAKSSRPCRCLPWSLFLPHRRVTSMRCWIALQACITTEPGAAVMDEAAAQRALASIALGFTPRVALADEAVLMDVTGSLRLFGGLARLMQLLEQRLAL